MIAAVYCFSTAAHAADNYFELNGFTFDINSEGKATIHDYNGDNTDVVIPNSLLRAPVVSVGDYAFYDKSITSVSFDTAAQLNSIGSCAFYNCTSLSELSIPSNVALSFSAFQNCSGLETLTIDEGIAEIPEQCFYRCSSLTEITLPDSVTTIGTRAFGECGSLHYAYLSENVTDIASNAFSGDSDLIICTQRDSYAAQYAKDNNIPVEYPYEYLIGDADGNGIVNIFDVTTLQRVLAKMMDDPDGMIALRGSVTGGTLSSIDVTVIQRFLAHMDTPYPVNETNSGWASAEIV